MTRVRLVAASDDFLLERRLAEVVAETAAALGGIEPELLGGEVSPEWLALELQSPSLFAPRRLLVVDDIRAWVDAPAPPEAPKVDDVDPAALVRALDDGLGDDVALVLGVWAGRAPKGPLVEAIGRAGTVEWLSLPEPPKPWEDVVLSQAQREMLGRLLVQAAGGVRFAPGAAELLMDRLGFAPRQLVAEAGKLALAVGGGGLVDEELVRRLTFPPERSLEVVEEAVVGRRPALLLDLLAAADHGLAVRDWQGRRVDSGGLPIVLFGQVFSLLTKLLYLVETAAAAGLAAELAPARTGAAGWYGRVFKSRLGPALLALLEARAPNPLLARSKGPSLWHLGRLAPGVGRYRRCELVAALATGGRVEADLRSAMDVDSLTAWLVRSIGRHAD